MIENQAYVVFDEVSVFAVCVHDDLGAFFSHKPDGVSTYFIDQSKGTSNMGRRVIVSYDTTQMNFNEDTESKKVTVLGHTNSIKKAVKIFHS